MINRLVVAAIALVVPIAASAAQAGPAQPQRATFVVTVGTDTLAVESVTRMSARVESDLAVRGQGANLHFVLALDAQALVSSMEIAVRLAAAAPTPHRARQARSSSVATA